MSWVKLDDRLLEHPKFVRAERLAGSSAVHLWLGLLCYCKQRLSDGVVPLDMVDRVPGPAPRWRGRALRALIDVGLVHGDGNGGIYLHDYLALNESRETIERKASERRALRERRPSVARAKADASDAAGLHGPRRAPETETETETETREERGPEVKEHPARKRIEARAKARGKGRESRWRNVAESHPDWQPNRYHAALAQKYGKDLRTEAARFRDHEFGVPKSDPDRTFNNWLRRDYRA